MKRQPRRPPLDDASSRLRPSTSTQWLALRPGRIELILRAGYVAVVLIATLSNLAFEPNLAAAHNRLVRALTPTIGWRDIIDGLRNILLFAGLSAVWVATSRSTRLAEKLRQAFVCAFILSVGSEGLQTFSPIREASILDVATDMVGALLGGLAFVMTLRLIERDRVVRGTNGIPITALAGPYLLAIFAEALTPLFDSAPLPVDGGPFDRLRLMWSHASGLSWAAFQIWDVPIFAAAGVLGVLIVRDTFSFVRGRWIVVAAIGSALVTTAHLAHGAAGLPIGWTPIVTDSAAFTAGVLLADQWLLAVIRRSSRASVARAALFAYLGLLLIWSLRPFSLAPSSQSIAGALTLEQFIPLMALAERPDLFSVTHVAQQFFLYIPLGALLAIQPAALPMKRSRLIAVVAFVTVIEFCHAFIATRTFDLTNAMLAWIGVAAGWALVRTVSISRPLSNEQAAATGIHAKKRLT